MTGMTPAASRANTQTIALLAGLVACTLATGAADEPALAARQADFREFVQDFVDNYAYLDRDDHRSRGPFPVTAF
jgi:hypothetical protein